jgi:two-component system OmpR family sensor kinase
LCDGNGDGGAAVSAVHAGHERPRPRFARWWPELALVVVCCFFLYLMRAWHGIDIPFYLVYLSVGLVYGLRMWSIRPAVLAIALVMISTGGLTLLDVSRGVENPAELIEVPLLALFYLTMVLHVRSRQRMLGMLSRVLNHEGRLHAYATHELMTPLTVARGEMELLIRNGRPSDEDLARTENVVLDELRRSEQLTSDLLLSAQFAFSEIDRHPLSAEDLVLDAVERWHGRMPGPLRIDAVACGTVLAAQDGLRRVLDNLLANAARHTCAGDVVRIASRNDGERLLITVVDEGSGIPTEDLAHVFDPFYRGTGDVRGVRPGPGLGLALVKDIVESHGGSVRIASTLGHGTSVTIDLPGFARSVLHESDPATTGN